MHKLFIKIFITLIICFSLIKNSFSQEIIYNIVGKDTTVSLIFPSVAAWESHKKKTIFLWEDNKSKDSLINECLLPGIENLNRELAEKDTAIRYHKKYEDNTQQQLIILQGNIVDLMTVRKPIFSYVGTFIGLKAGYVFGSDNSSKLFMSNVADNMSIMARTVITVKRLFISPSLQLKVSNGVSPGVFLDIEYNPF
jgi:hypothetical protein